MGGSEGRPHLACGTQASFLVGGSRCGEWTGVSGCENWPGHGRRGLSSCTAPGRPSPPRSVPVTPRAVTARSGDGRGDSCRDRHGEFTLSPELSASEPRPGPLEAARSLEADCRAPRWEDTHMPLELLILATPVPATQWLPARPDRLDLDPPLQLRAWHPRNTSQQPQRWVPGTPPVHSCPDVWSGPQTSISDV